MCIISAYTVQTSTPSFAPCSWPATSETQAERLAQSLSLSLATDKRYPNAFWVSDGSISLGKYYRGKRYNPSQSI